ncbi:MAG TPA: class I SAM-dependent methyltransferase [Candidatus Acidoferrum sp.]|nr:class I SAM-dependent methyltransferase [Candidatus Acidoferrum sp.]
MSASSQPSPDLFFETLTAYQKTAALKAAVDLNLFTALADGPLTATEVAARCQSAARSTRILCDYLTVLGFLNKADECYSLTPDSAVFLNRKSSAYAGGAAEFLLSDHLTNAFENLADSVRKGGTAEPQQGSIAPEHPMWMTFARTMGGLMTHAAEGLAELIPLDAQRPSKVLDISASHGAWGIAFAKRYPQAHLAALDWAPVLEVAREHARAANIADRFSTIAGSAFDVGLGDNYDVVLVPNFLHHFNAADCVRFLKRAHSALRPGGTVAIVEFVPNPDRITPPAAASFSLVMLATTPEGDAYTSAEYSDMLAQSGFKAPTMHPLPASLNVAVLAKK